MAAGVIVAAAAFLLSKNATTFFQHEARISSAQLAASLGMTRIAADLQRASFMSSPNIQRNGVGRCGSTAVFPVGLGSLAGIYIEENGSAIAWPGQLTQSADNGLTPDRLIIGGSFSTTEQFPVQFLESSGVGGQSVYLQTDTGAMARVRDAQTKGGDSILTIFAAGRILRVLDPTGRQMYGVIAGTTEVGGNVIVQLEAGTPLQEKEIANDCGWGGLGVGMLANPVSRIRYDVRSMVGDPVYGALVNPPVTELTAEQKAATGDTGRTELVRTELDAFDVALSTELVAEYTVDLKFGLTLATPGITPTLTRFPIPMASAIYANAGDVIAPASTPERIRAVQVRLSTRTRLADRSTALPAGPDGRLSRFRIDPAMPSPRFARMRTLYADISLPNQAGISW